jgi:hypothetical protein
MEKNFVLENMPLDVVGNILSYMEVNEVGNLKSASKKMKKNIAQVETYYNYGKVKIDAIGKLLPPYEEMDDSDIDHRIRKINLNLLQTIKILHQKD